jgi:hypothetical protein
MANFQVELPSGRTIEFRELSFSARKQMINRARSQELPMTLSELLAAAAIVSINGAPPAEVDPALIFDTWSIRDTLLYVDVFTNTGIVSEEDLTSTREKSKQLLKAGKISLRAVPEVGVAEATA